MEGGRILVKSITQINFILIISLAIFLSIVTFIAHGIEILLILLFIIIIEMISLNLIYPDFYKKDGQYSYKIGLLLAIIIIFGITLSSVLGLLAIITLSSYYFIIIYKIISIKPKIINEKDIKTGTWELIADFVSPFHKTYLKIKDWFKEHQELTQEKLTAQEEYETTEHIDERISEIEKCYKGILEKDTYLIHSEKTNSLNLCKSHLKEITLLKSNQDAFSAYLISSIDEAINKIKETINKIEKYNELFVKGRKEKYDDLLRTSNYPLDDYQKTAVITDDKYNLVVAGAGSGKTAVLTNRIAYLIEREPDTVSPDKILALAFQSNASEEMKERIKNRWNYDVEIRTFHSFGKKLIQQHTGVEAKLLARNKNNLEKLRIKLIKELYEEELKNSQFQDYIIDYMKYIGSEEKILEIPDFKTREENYNYRKNQKIKTLNGWEVRSPAERDIMNFFLSHKLDGEYIDIEYEEPPEEMYYEGDEGILKHLYPDFFFPKYDIYLEHWAVDKDNKSFFPNYEEGMNKKIQMFSEQEKYILFETRAYEYEENSDKFKKLLEKRFIDALKKKSDKKYDLSPIKYVELVDKVWYDCKKFVDKIPNNISKFIKIAKVYDLKPKDLKQRLQKEPWLPIQKTFANIAIIIFEKYLKQMKKEDKIDFEDMINNAIDILKENKDFYRNSFEHILIDEYQDISEQRGFIPN